MSTRAGERRIVSVLIADVVGSTAIAERLGPERSKFLFDDVVRLLREEVERFGGTVAQLTGDGVLALFGAPLAHEGDAERAVRAALAIQDATAAYAREVEKAYGVELAARIAVNTGPVVVPEDEEPPERLYNALGDTVNVAARLQSLGHVVVGPETAAQVEGRFELERLGEVELKGKAAPVAAFRVAGERAGPTETVLSPLVGRDDELAGLEEVFEQLVEGRGAIVAVAGEPGIGKSRLTTDAREHFHDRIDFLEGHAASYTEEIPYWPLRELLRDWLGLGRSDPEARVRLELRAELVGAVGGEAEDLYPFLASVLALPLERAAGERFRELSRDSVRQQTFDAVRRLVCALAAERPLCLIFEDLQWTDEATFALLENLFAVTEEEPIALVLSYRTGQEHRAWDLAERARRRYRHRFLEIELAPLPPKASRELAARAAQADLPESVRVLLAERSGGNPFFLEEALRDLIERGVLRRQNGQLELANGGNMSVPAAVQEALQARLDRLDPATRELIGVASVVGQTFGTPLLERLLPKEQVRPALSELQRLDLVIEARRRPAPEYRFRHGLVQEVAYGGLLETRRRELHRAVGEALEQLHDGSPEEVYGLLARHYSEADDPARAAEYLLKAGDLARGLYAENEAIELYRRALGFIGQTGDEPSARETLLKIALTHHLAFDFEQASRAYQEAFARTAPAPQRLEPAETIETSYLRSAAFAYVPGVGFDEVASDLARHLYRGLVTIGRELEIVPDVAEAFEVTPDGLTYRFRLRPDALWSDGNPVTAGDFSFGWERMREAGFASSTLHVDVASTEALDARTLEIGLREPRSHFLYLLGQPTFFAWPRHAYEALGPAWYERVPLVGNGPFLLAELRQDEVVMVANEKWHGPRGNVKAIRAELLPGTDQQRLGRWLAGRYDALCSPYVDVPAGDETYIVEPAPRLATTYLAFRADRPPFDARLLRRAFAHAIDRERLVAAAGLLADHAGRGGFVPPAMPGHSHRVAPGYDPDRARQLLEEAGFLKNVSERPIMVAMAQALGPGMRDELDRQLEAAGARAEVRLVPFAAMQSTVDELADAWVWGWNADFPDPDAMFTGFLANYRTVYQDQRFLRRIEQARSIFDRDHRLRAYREAEQSWIGEDVALIPLAYGRQLTLRRPWLRGFWANAMVTSTFAEAVVHRNAVHPQERPERSEA